MTSGLYGSCRSFLLGPLVWPSMVSSMHALPVKQAPAGARPTHTHSHARWSLSGAPGSPGMSCREAFLATVVVLLAASLWISVFFRAGDTRLPNPNPTVVTPQVSLPDGSSFQFVEHPVDVGARQLSDAVAQARTGEDEAPLGSPPYA